MSVLSLDFLIFLCYTSSIRKLEKVSKLERFKMNSIFEKAPEVLSERLRKFQCPECGYSGNHTQECVYRSGYEQTKNPFWWKPGGVA
jgi:hypothetical protein